MLTLEKHKTVGTLSSNQNATPMRVNFFRRRSTQSAPRQRQRPAETRMQALTNRAKGRVADEVVKSYDQWAEKRRLWYVEDPDMPSSLRRVARAPGPCSLRTSVVSS